MTAQVDPWDVVLDHVRQLLVALGLGDHARPVSAHEVVVGEVLPAIEQLRAGRDEVAAAVRIATLEELRGRLVELGNAYSITSQTRAVSVDHMVRLQSKGHGVDRAVVILDELLTEARQ